jgi:hypothetical protein
MNSASNDRWWLALAALAAAVGVVAALAWEMPLPYWGE